MILAMYLSCKTILAPPLVNADQIVCGIFRKICALISSLFLEIHKVFLRKSAIIKTQIFSESALADLIIVYLKTIFTIFIFTRLSQKRIISL